VVATTTKTALHQELLEVAEALSAPIDFNQLIADGVLRKSRGWYEILDPSRLPDHAWSRIKSVKSRNRVKFRKANKRAAKLLNGLSAEPVPAR
jgi:hypothetical protein